MRRLRLSALVVALAVALLLPGQASSQQKSIKSQLVGTWTVASWVQSRKDGTKFQRFGPAPKGVNVFDSSGHFFVMFARPELPKIASNDANNPTHEEALAIVKGSIAYFGTYTVDEATKTIEFRIEASTLPNQLGIVQKRKITKLTGSELAYTNTTVIGGAGNIDIALKRAP